MPLGRRAVAFRPPALDGQPPASFLPDLMNRILLLLLALGFPGATAAQDFRPNLGPELPRIEVTCGDVTVLLRQASQWTPGRIDFRGSPMTTEKSAYGTVFLFPEVGFIGTAHLENEPEDLQSLSFRLDGKAIDPATAELAGKEFSLERHSRIRDFELINLFEIRDDRIYETATISTAKNVPLKLVYHFMHAWAPTASAYVAGTDDDPETVDSGPLHDGEEIARKFFVNDTVDWFAIYEPESGQFAVSRLLEKPEGEKASSKVWNVPGSYRKYYLTSFQNQTVPAGFKGTWRMVTGFGEASLDEWETEARRLARRLNEDAE